MLLSNCSLVMASFLKTSLKVVSVTGCCSISFCWRVACVRWICVSTRSIFSLESTSEGMVSPPPQEKNGIDRTTSRNFLSMMAKIGIECVAGEGEENGTLIGRIERMHTDGHCVNGNGTRRTRMSGTTRRNGTLMGRIERIHTDVHCVNGNGTRRTQIAQ